MEAVERLRQQLLNEHLANIALVGSERHQIQQDLAAMQKQRDEAFATIEKTGLTCSAPSP